MHWVYVKGGAESLIKSRETQVSSVAKMRKKLFGLKVMSEWVSHSLHVSAGNLTGNLTGNLGVICLILWKKFESVIHCEQNVFLCVKLKNDLRAKSWHTWQNNHKHTKVYLKLKLVTWELLSLLGTLAFSVRAQTQSLCFIWGFLVCIYC